MPQVRLLTTRADAKITSYLPLHLLIYHSNKLPIEARKSCQNSVRNELEPKRTTRRSVVLTWRLALYMHRLVNLSSQLQDSNSHRAAPVQQQTQSKTLVRNIIFIRLYLSIIVFCSTEELSDETYGCWPLWNYTRKVVFCRS